jgi:choline/glycine/proline betaine transport protein
MEYENSIDFFMVVGPTIFIFKSFVQNTGNYLSSILELSTGQSYTGANLAKCRTVFTGDGGLHGRFRRDVYCSNFKGRTVREFILGVC